MLSEEYFSWPVSDRFSVATWRTEPGPQRSRYRLIGELWPEMVRPARLRSLGAMARSGLTFAGGLPTVAHAPLASVSEGWCARQDSNLRPLAPEANALSS